MITKMKSEAIEASIAVEKQLKSNATIIQDIADDLSAFDPYSIVSIARGSSDHAAQFLNYLTMEKLGLLPTTLSLSILTLYKARLKVNRSIALAISQSGQSPDVIDPIVYFNKCSAPTVGFVNDVTSPLAREVKYLIPLQAGAEKSVAATKSFICSLSASAHLLSCWSKDEKLARALIELPEDLHKAQQNSWSNVISSFAKAKRIMVVGRGYGLSLALETALKFKETCSIQAEAFSAAEIKHGPQALIEEGYPLLIYANRGPALHSMLDLAQDMRNRGANVILAAPSFVKEKDLEITSAGTEELDTITAVQSFYLMVEELSRHLGYNPDEPKHLSKVTKTH